MFLVSRARSNENTMIRRGHFSRFISDATILRALVFLGRERNPGGEDRVRDISWEGNLCLAGLKEKKNYSRVCFFFFSLQGGIQGCTSFVWFNFLSLSGTIR